MGFTPTELFICSLCHGTAARTWLLYFVSSRATFYNTSDGLGTPTGACGYLEYGRTINYAKVTGVSSALYRGGLGCGACYQVRCKLPSLCTTSGVTVVVTDYGEGDRTDFILSNRGYTGMARAGAVNKLVSYGVVPVEYQRVSCQYPGNNIKVKVLESSRFPDYLALTFLYVGGKNDITDVQVWQPHSHQWTGMRRSYGAVWDLPNPPTGPITIRIYVTGSAGNEWVKLNGVIPRRWRVGAAYDTGLQLS
ncbi:unnamed protein product [Thlaspi arvense]|uniref:Expansin-like B1 n=1 Tax=Thlaspi arvense TaxID=13288 RepID=A0AAU9RH29_THLAR|nr:unnamed protein product [Thlaspi arvense]